jgi:hypothetical protein
MSDNKYPYLNFPTIIDITLYKNNYYDNLLVNKIKKDADYGDLPELKDCYVVLAEDFQSIFYNSFSTEVNKIKSLPNSDLHKNATSLYFIDKIFSSFTGLKYVKVNVSREANYSRINKSEKIPTIFFNYKITSSTINLDEIFEPDILTEINNFLIESGFVDEDPVTGLCHIVQVTALEFLTALEAKASQSEQASYIEYLFELIDPKTQQDNPVIFFITDFDI